MDIGFGIAECDECKKEDYVEQMIQCKDGIYCLKHGTTRSNIEAWNFEREKMLSDAPRIIWLSILMGLAYLFLLYYLSH